MAKQTTSRPSDREVMMVTEPVAAASRKSTSRGRGDKYDLVKTVLRVEPATWINRRRQANFRRPDGRRGMMSFREIADAITEKMRERLGSEAFVTLESVRRWHRKDSTD